MDTKGGNKSDVKIHFQSKSPPGSLTRKAEEDFRTENVTHYDTGCDVTTARGSNSPLHCNAVSYTRIL